MGVYGSDKLKHIVLYFTLDMHYKHLLEPPFSLSANYITRLSHLINCNFEKKIKIMSQPLINSNLTCADYTKF